MKIMEEFAASRLAVGSAELWQPGTSARFLDAVGDGTLPEEAFNRWLVQDYLFVQGFTRFLAVGASRTPRPAQSAMIGGLAALDDELGWFESHAEVRGLDLAAAAHPTCRRYVDHLVAAAYTEPVEVLLAILYGVEVAYTVAWGKLTAQGPYAEFIERWTCPEFQEYVSVLLRLVDAHPHPGQQPAFDEVMRHEREFWRMTWEG
jgi:thiaminase/transcriptional activator TenA